MSTKKTEATSKILDLVQFPYPMPERIEGASLIEHGIYAILLRHLSADQARAILGRLQKRYADWNELRVAQAQEVADVMKSARTKAIPAARDVKTFLQEVFQQSHGLDLEFLRDDFQTAARFVNQLSFLGLATANWLLTLATGNEVLVTPAIVRVLDRTGLVPRTASQKRARAAIEPLVPKDESQRFAMVLGHVAQTWCDPRKPICWECPLVEICKNGKKVKKDWLVQQERLEVQKQREEARQAKLAKQEAERVRREEIAAKKKSEIEAKKKAREDERKKRVEEKEREKREREAARERERAEREREKQEREKAKAVAAKKKATLEAKKLEAAKKAAAKKKAKKTAKKAPPRKKKTTTRKTAKKTPAKKAAPAKKKAPASKAARKAPAKKTTKKTAKAARVTRKKTGKKTTARSRR